MLILIAVLPLTRGLKDLIGTRPPGPLETPRAQAETAGNFPHDSLGLPILPGYFSARNPARAEEGPIVAVEGRPIPLENGSAIIWRIEGADYILERRRITLGDIFKTRTVL